MSTSRQGLGVEYIKVEQLQIPLVSDNQPTINQQASTPSYHSQHHPNQTQLLNAMSAPNDAPNDESFVPQNEGREEYSNIDAEKEDKEAARSEETGEVSKRESELLHIRPPLHTSMCIATLLTRTIRC
jgi:hypothetical protein